MRTPASTQLNDFREPDALGRKNLTRRTRGMPWKLAREGRLHFLPVYWLLMQSDLGREGIEHSGSYRFADHIYRNEPSGRNWLGKWVDARLLRLPASRALRQRYLHAQMAVRSALQRHLETSADAPFRILAVPCGIPRDIAELAGHLRTEHAEWPSRIHYTGMDLDPGVLELAHGAMSGTRLGDIRLKQADALRAGAYSERPYHCVVSTGLGEFLTDEELLGFYGNVHSALTDRGTFYTSATRCEPRSAALLKAFELEVHYRSASELRRLLQTLPWRSVALSQDSTGLQTFAVAEK